jgi:sulfoxide reductase heme-binding subunit YedZ
MVRKLGWLVIAGLLWLALTGLAQAAGPTVTLPMTGQALAQTTTAGQSLAVNATATDGSGWQLAATLTPTSSGRARGGDDGRAAAMTLTGPFTLQNSNGGSITGTATAQVATDGSGQIQLASPDGQTSLTSGITIDPAGGVQLTLQGTLGTAATASGAGPVATATSASPAQPINQTFWYITRAAGFTTYVLLTVTVVLGLLVQTRLMDALVARWQSFDLHQFTALLALAFLALHVLSLLGDQYYTFHPSQLLVPFTAPYRPADVALGVVTMYLLVIIVGSFYLRRYIGYQTWRAIHYATFGAYILALGHGILSGTDSGQPWAMLLYASTGLLVLGLTLWRMNREPDQKRPVPAARPVARPTARPAAARALAPTAEDR